ncbi:MAG TPA: GWxTD domain-containing protein [Gemmatimonadales bacterium]|nr:GWxTD domain-containing protein [Gemmatimonadales bacterium]
MHRHVRSLAAIALAVSLAHWPTGPLAAQTPAERANVDAFRDSLGALADPGVVAQLVAREKTARPATGDKEIQRLRLGWALTRYGQLTDSAPPMVEALLQFYEASVRRRQWPYAHFGLGATKLALDAIGAREIRSEHQPAGSGWRFGAASAFLASVQADTNYVTAAVELGLTVMRTPGWVNVQPVVVAMSRAARSGRAGNGVWLVLGRLERLIDSNAAALRAFDTYAGLEGVDQSMAQLERARTLFALGQNREGETAYLTGAANPSPDARALYRKDAAWIADSAELAEIDAASGTDLPAVLGRFWRDRETRSGRAAGSRLAEHYRRWNLAERRYKLPDALKRQWDFGQVFRSSQSEVDDRGVIFIRHGEPDDRATLMADNVSPNESWVYHRPTGDLVLHFVQSISSSGWRLIEGLTQIGAPPCLMPALLDSRAPLDPNYQVLADLARADSVKIASAAKNGNNQAREFLQACVPGNLSAGQAFAAVVGISSSGVSTSFFGTQRETQERLASHRSIVASTTTDSDPLRYRDPLNPILQVYGVGGRQPGAGQLLVVWALKGEDHPLADTVPGVQGVVYSVRLRATVTDTAGKLMLAVDSVYRKRSNVILPDGSLLPGKMMLSVPAGAYRILLSVADTQGRKGAARVAGGIPVPAFTGPMEMSDLVLGLEGQPIFWDRGGSRFPLNPRNAWTTAEAMEIGFELGGVAPGTPYKVRLGVADIGADSTTPPKASVEFENQASGGREFVSQSLVLRTLRPGRYLLTATVMIGDTVLRREKRITVVQAR